MARMKNSVPEKVPVFCFNVWNYRFQMVFTNIKKRSQLLINEYSWLRLVTKMLEPLSPQSPVSRKIYRTFLIVYFFDEPKYTKNNKKS